MNKKVEYYKRIVFISQLLIKVQEILVRIFHPLYIHFI